MNFNEYQNQAFTTARYPQKGTGSFLAVMYVSLGLGEAGEAQGKMKKIIRDYFSEDLLTDFKSSLPDHMKNALIDEMADVLWYISAMATELGISLEEVAQRNLTKLFGRVERGTIGGSGDER